MAEVFKPVQGWPYEVSRNGVLRSMRTGRVVATKPNPQGYMHFIMSAAGVKRSTGVHRLVCEAWLGPVPAGMHINHKDGIKTNNCLDNLEVVTPAENAAHAVRTGLIPAGEAVGWAKLTDAAVVDIYTGSASEISAAKQYGVAARTVRGIRSGKWWRHVTENLTRGSGGTNKKLAPAQVLEIFASEVPTRQLAADYGVSPTAVNRIRSGRLWRHITLAKLRDKGMA